MCFHTELTKIAIELETRFEATFDNPLEFQPHNHINGFEFPKTPVIIDEKPQIITQYNWGLIPAWAKDEEIQKHTLNAKIETITEKPSFKNSVNKRCLVIADGYYEWQWLDPKGKIKQKYKIGLPNEELFTFAGLHQHRSSNQKKNSTAVNPDFIAYLYKINSRKKTRQV
jgi:putative SOS response-associated peptidase YedK